MATKCNDTNENSIEKSGSTNSISSNDSTSSAEPITNPSDTISPAVKLLDDKVYRNVIKTATTNTTNSAKPGEWQQSYGQDSCGGERISGSSTSNAVAANYENTSSLTALNTYQSLKIKTKSIENTLLPLVNQVGNF